MLRVAILKSVSWKAVGTSTLFIISYLLGLGLEQTSKITVAYHVITFFLYILHEKLWYRAWRKYFSKP